MCYTIIIYISEATYINVERSELGKSKTFAHTQIVFEALYLLYIYIHTHTYFIILRVCNAN